MGPAPADGIDVDIAASAGPGPSLAAVAAAADNDAGAAVLRKALDAQVNATSGLLDSMLPSSYAVETGVGRHFDSYA